jgi:DNA-binding transcriptional LysR family regulator
MHPTDLSGIDLNLLLALDAILSERSVTRAAEKLGLTQPGMSRALARLREIVDDPILVRTPQGMALTGPAEQMREPVRRAMEAVGRALGKRARFDPASATCCFTIATTDYIELVLLPALLARLSKEAPGVEIEVRPVFGDIHRMLETGDADLVIGIIFEEAASFYRQSLFDDHLVCLLRSDHPLADTELSIEDYLRLSHVLIAPRGKKGGMVDDVLSSRGLSRRVQLRVPNYIGAPHIVARSDLCLTVASRIASEMLKILPLRQFALPLDVPGFSVAQYWHERHHIDPTHAWLRGVVLDTAGSI